MFRCVVCGNKIEPGHVTCGEKECIKDFNRRNFISNTYFVQFTPKAIENRRNYLYFHYISLARTNWSLDK